MKRISLALIVVLGLTSVASQGYDKQALGGWSVGVNPDKVVHAINCGGNEDITDLLGVHYKADYSFNGGVTSDEGGSAQWVLPNSDVYHSERYGNNDGFKYFLTIPKDGLYALVLKFSEVYFNEPGNKVFDVKLGNEIVIQDLDIFGKVESRGIPYDEFIEFMVKAGKLYIQGQEVPNAIKNGKLTIEFAVGKADNPKVNAILLVEGGLANTHYKAHQRYLQELEKIKQLQRQQMDQQQQRPEQSIEFQTTFDYFAEDEDPFQPKTKINSFLEKPYLPEIASLAFLFFFFTFLTVLGDHSEEEKLKND